MWIFNMLYRKGWIPPHPQPPIHPPPPQEVNNDKHLPRIWYHRGIEVYPIISMISNKKKTLIK